MGPQSYPARLGLAAVVLIALAAFMVFLGFTGNAGLVFLSGAFVVLLPTIVLVLVGAAALKYLTRKE